MSPEEITNRFSFHPADTPQRVAAHNQTRVICGQVATLLDALVPDGREKALAFTHLEEVMMWSNAAIARAA